MIASISLTSSRLLHFGLKETQTQELQESMKFWVKEPLVLKEKQGREHRKGSEIWNSERRHWCMKVEGEIEGTQKTIKPLILIATTFVFMSDNHENIKNCLRTLSEAPIFFSARVLFYGREAVSTHSSLPSAPAASWNWATYTSLCLE